jgi:hypothetical protein
MHARGWRRCAEVWLARRAGARRPGCLAGPDGQEHGEQDCGSDGAPRHADPSARTPPRHILACCGQRYLPTRRKFSDASTRLSYPLSQADLDRRIAPVVGLDCLPEWPIWPPAGHEGLGLVRCHPFLPPPQPLLETRGLVWRCLEHSRLSRGRSHGTPRGSRSLDMAQQVPVEGNEIRAVPTGFSRPGQPASKIAGRGTVPQMSVKDGWKLALWMSLLPMTTDSWIAMRGAGPKPLLATPGDHQGAGGRIGRMLMRAACSTPEPVSSQSCATGPLAPDQAA